MRVEIDWARGLASVRRRPGCEPPHLLMRALRSLFPLDLCSESALLALREAWDALDFGRVLRDPLAPQAEAAQTPQRVQRLYEASIEAAVEGLPESVLRKLEEDARERRWGDERAAAGVENEGGLHSTDEGEEEDDDIGRLPDPVALALEPSELPPVSLGHSSFASSTHDGLHDDELLQELLSLPLPDVRVGGPEAPSQASRGPEAPSQASPTGPEVSTQRSDRPVAAPDGAAPQQDAAAAPILPSPLALLPLPDALRSLPLRSIECREGALLVLLFLFSASFEASGWRLEPRQAASARRGSPSPFGLLVAPASGLVPLSSFVDSLRPALPDPVPAKIYLSLEAQRGMLLLAETLAKEGREVGRRALAELRARRAFVPGGPTPVREVAGPVRRGGSRAAPLYASCDAASRPSPLRSRPPLWSRAARLGLGPAAVPEEGEALAREIRFGAAMGLSGIEAAKIGAACSEHAAALTTAWERLAAARKARAEESSVEGSQPTPPPLSIPPPSAPPPIADLDFGDLLAEYARLKTAHVLRVLRGEDSERPIPVRVAAPARPTASKRARRNAPAHQWTLARVRPASSSRAPTVRNPTSLAAMDIASDRRRLPRSARMALARDAARRRELERRVADWLRLAPEAPVVRRPRDLFTPIDHVRSEGGTEQPDGADDACQDEDDMPLLPGLPDTWESAPAPAAGLQGAAQASARNGPELEPSSDHNAPLPALASDLDLPELCETDADADRRTTARVSSSASETQAPKRPLAEEAAGDGSDPEAEEGFRRLRRKVASGPGDDIAAFVEAQRTTKRGGGAHQTKAALSNAQPKVVALSTASRSPSSGTAEEASEEEEEEDDDPLAILRAAREALQGDG